MMSQRAQRAQPFQHFSPKMLTDKSPQAKHRETDPHHDTPTMAHFPPLEIYYSYYYQRHINGVVSTTTNHNHFGFGGIKRPFLIRPGLTRPGLCSPKYYHIDMILVLICLRGCPLQTKIHIHIYIYIYIYIY